MALAAYYAKLVYNANGGSGAPASQSAFSDEPSSSVYVTLSAGATRQYYKFNGWAPSSSASSGRTPGGKYYMTTSDTMYAANARVYTLYATWVHETATLSYNANGGSGAPSAQTVNKNEWFALRTGVPTRSGYEFVGWNTSSTATAATYQPGDQARIVSNMTLYAVWKVSNSTISTISSSVPIDGSTQGSVSISSINNSYTHQLTLSIGESSQVISLAAGVTSATFTIPTSWLAEVPNSTTGTARASLKTFNGSTQVGVADVKTFSITVPASVVPSVSVVTDFVNSNAVVDGWDILLQNYSQIKLTATAAGGTGASISNIAFSGDGLSQTGSATEATSAVLTASGSRSWTVIATDSRGRTATATVTETVHEYHSPSIAEIIAFRADSSGNRDDAAGTYISAQGTFTYASADGNNDLSVDQFEYQAEDVSRWTVGANNVVSGSHYVFGGGLITETKMFHIRLSLTDALGNSAQYVVDVSPIVGYGFGLKNDRVHFGGPCKEPGFVCDFPTKLVNGHVVGSHSASGNYAKVVTFKTDVNPSNINVNAPITIEYARSGDTSPTRLTIGFNRDYTLASFTSSNSVDAYLHNLATATWDLYIGKSSSSDSVEILDFHNPWSNTDMTVEWEDTSISTLPTGYVTASLASIPNNIGDLIDTGKRIFEYPANINLASGTPKTTVSITLPKGIWLLMGTVQFNSNSSGIRTVYFATSSDSSTDMGAVYKDLRPAVNGGQTYCRITAYYTNSSSSTTLYLIASQNSGSTISTAGRIMAVKIA